MWCMGWSFRLTISCKWLWLTHWSSPTPTAPLLSPFLILKYSSFLVSVPWGLLCAGLLLAGSPAHQVTLCFGDNMLRADHLACDMRGCGILCASTLEARISLAGSALLPSCAFCERLPSHEMRLNLLLCRGPDQHLCAVWPSADTMDWQQGWDDWSSTVCNFWAPSVMERSSSHGADNSALGSIQLPELPEAVWMCVKKENLQDAELSFYLPEMSWFIPLG